MGKQNIQAKKVYCDISRQVFFSAQNKFTLNYIPAFFSV